ncbi:MAG: GTP cyclohydrolase I FolE [PVC group bacterium]
MDKEKIKKAVRDLLTAVGEDPSRPGLRKTPDRVAEMCGEILGGVGMDIAREIRVFPCPGFDEIVLLKDIPFYSLCEHHLLPFFGRVHIAYIPKDSKITGLSTLVRVVELFSRRLQVQERMTTELADLLMAKLRPRGVLVQIEAEHLCMNMRGVKKPGTLVKTEAVRGNFRRDERTRAEALSLLRNS